MCVFFSQSPLKRGWKTGAARKLSKSVEFFTLFDDFWRFVPCAKNFREVSKIFLTLFDDFWRFLTWPLSAGPFCGPLMNFWPECKMLYRIYNVFGTAHVRYVMFLANGMCPSWWAQCPPYDIEIIINGLLTLRIFMWGHSQYLNCETKTSFLSQVYGQA